ASAIGPGRFAGAKQTGPQKERIGRLAGEVWAEQTKWNTLCVFSAALSRISLKWLDTPQKKHVEEFVLQPPLVALTSCVSRGLWTMNMGPDQVAMLVGGALLFVVALGLPIYCVVTRRSFKAVLFLFLVAIIMIGFPSITHFKILGAEVELNRSLAAVEENPNDSAARD